MTAKTNGLKQCRKCGQVFAISNFRVRPSRSTNGNPYADSYCKPCRCAADREQRKKVVVHEETIRRPFIPPVDFIPILAPIERRALVATI